MLGNAEKAAQVLRGREIPSELKQRVEYLADFPRMVDAVSGACTTIEKIIDD